MVRLARGLAVVLFAAGCQLPLADGCPDGGGCPAGSYCGADGFCHAGTGSGASGAGVTTGSNGGSGAGATGSGTGTTGSVGASGSSGTHGSSGGVANSTGGTGSSSGSASSTGSSGGLACASPTGGSAGPQTISGTVTYVGTATGQIFLELQQVDTGNANNGYLLGTSLHVCGPGTYAFSLSGLGAAGVDLSQSYVVQAWFDELGICAYDSAVDPFDSQAVSPSGTSSLVLAAPTIATPTQAPMLQAVAGAGGVLALWSQSSAAQEGDQYVVCLASSANAAAGSGSCQTFAPWNLGILTPSGSGPYFASVAALVHGDAGPFSSPGIPVAVNDGGATLTGTVDGLPSRGGTLCVLAVDEGSGQSQFGFTELSVSGPSTAFSIPNLPPAEYRIFAFLDAAGTGQPQPGDLIEATSLFQLAGLCLPGGQPCQVTLPSGDVSAAAAFVTSGDGADYDLLVHLWTNGKLPVQATIEPVGGSGPIDLPLIEQGPPLAGYSLSWDMGSSAPTFTSLTLDVTCSDGTLDSIVLDTGTPFSSPPTIYLDGGNDVIYWSAPQGGSGSTTYDVTLFDSSCTPLFLDNGLTAPTLTPDAGLPQNAAGASVVAIDSNGNTVETQLGSCDGGSSQGSSSGSTGGQSGGSTGGTGGGPTQETVTGTIDYHGAFGGPIFITLTSQGGDGVLAGTGLTYQLGPLSGPIPFSFHTVAGGDTLTAYMDATQTVSSTNFSVGNYVFPADPVATASWQPGDGPVALVLADPPSVTVSAPLEPPNVMLGPGVIVGFSPIIKNQREQACAYQVNWSGGSSSGGSGQIPAGSGTVYADPGVTLTPGATYTFSYVGIDCAGTPGPASPSTPVTYTPGSVTLSGPLSIPPFSSATSYVGVDYASFEFAPLTGASPTSYAMTLPFIQTGPLFSFVDVTQNGCLGPTDPGRLPYEYAPAPTWDGGAFGPLVTISGAGVTCSVVSNVLEDDSSTQLSFSLQSNLDFPYAATVESTSGIPAFDLGALNHVDHHFTLGGQVTVPGVPPTGQVYPIQTWQLTQGFTSVFAQDGGTELCNATGTILALPTALSPSGSVSIGSPPTPTFSWTLPDPAAIELCQVDVFSADAGTREWYDVLQPCPSSVNYGAAGGGTPAALQSGSAYQWTFQINDNVGNQRTVSTTFTPQ